jgi:hypothetical protein
MFSRALLHSAAVTAIIIGTAALSNQALAQKSSVLEPLSSWAVTSVESEGSSGAYCAMARRFKDGVIMTVAKNNKDETSLAMDFANSEFNPEQSVAIVLDPGAGEQRNYDLKPVSKKAFVVRLGQDEKFFTALERTGFLRAEVGDQSYYFNLADIDKGNRQLDGCLYSMAAPASGDYDGMMPMPGEGNVLPGGGSQFSARIETLEKENETLRIALAQAGKKTPTAINPYPVGVQGVDKEVLSDDQSAMRTELLRLRRDNAALAADINEMKAVSSKAPLAGGERAELLNRIAMLEEENRKLSLGPNEPVAYLTGQAAEVLGQRIADLQNENRRLAAAQQETKICAAEPSSAPQPLTSVVPSEAPREVPMAAPVAPASQAAPTISVPPDMAEPVALPDKQSSLPSEPDKPANAPHRVYGILHEQRTLAPQEKIAGNDTADDEEIQALSTQEAPVPASADDIADVLRSAGVKLNDPVVTAELRGAFGDTPVYRWRASEVSGSAEQRIINESFSFEEAVQEYMQAYQTRCGGGDFAVEADNDREAGGTRIASFDVACVGRGVDMSAALLFVSRDGVLTVIAHEAATERLSLAMGFRDSLTREISARAGLEG